MLREVIFILIILIIAGCEIDPIDMNKVERNVELRLKESEVNKITECKQKALIDAEIYVDSIITEIIRNSIFDNMFFPERPKRDTTDIIFEIEHDTVSIKTLLDNMMRND